MNKHMAEIKKEIEPLLEKIAKLNRGIYEIQMERDDIIRGIQDLYNLTYEEFKSLYNDS